MLKISTRPRGEEHNLPKSVAEIVSGLDTYIGDALWIPGAATAAEIANIKSLAVGLMTAGPNDFANIIGFGVSGSIPYQDTDHVWHLLNPYTKVVGDVLTLDSDKLPTWTPLADNLIMLGGLTLGTGALIYMGATGLAVLPAGTEGQVLTMASGVPTWVTPT